MADAAGSFRVRQMKAEYLKRKADEALKAGNYGEAMRKYADCLQVRPEVAGSEAIFSNRSMACCRAGRYEEALRDAQQVVKMKPNWVKGHWRAASAFKYLKKCPEAIAALEKAHSLEPGNSEVRGEMWKCVQMLTREQIGAWCVDRWSAMEEEGAIHPAALETVSREEMVEAIFRHIYASHQNEPKPGPYYRKMMQWLASDGRGMDASEAYTERSCMYLKAKCFLQAQHDAKLAIATIQKDHIAASQKKSRSGDGNPELVDGAERLARAYFQLGKSCMAAQNHADRDPVQATKAFSQALDLCPDNDQYQAKLKEAGEELTQEQMSKVLSELYNKGSHTKGLGLHHPLSLGIVEEPKQGQRIFRVDASVSFPGAKPTDFGSQAREVFRKAVAQTSGVSLVKVMIAKVQRLFDDGEECKDATTEICFQVQFGTDFDKASELVRSLKDAEAALAAIGGDALVQCLGPINHAKTCAEVKDVTPTYQELSGDTDNGVDGMNGIEYGELLEANDDMQIALPSRPKTDIELPYKLYKLVQSNGSLIERADKHGFCMSRCYYNKTELPQQEVWVEVCDGSCRWRQSSDEVKIIATSVPPNLPSGCVKVKIEPYFVSVENIRTNETYFEGELERGIIPEQSIWEYGKGVNEDGLVVYLKKMNLELLSKSHQHAEMWWPKLCKHHGDICWDDYEKDYSDLPEPIMRQYLANEAQTKLISNIEYKERLKREALQEADDLRKRQRQERLHEMRTGDFRSWVHLTRDSSPKSIVHAAKTAK